MSHSFGYGLMDATAMVRLARTWQTVPEQHKCEVSAPHINKWVDIISMCYKTKATKGYSIRRDSRTKQMHDVFT